MKKFSEFKIGDTALFVPFDLRFAKPRMVSVTKKGKQYTYFNNQPVREYNNGFCFGIGKSSVVTGTYYESREAYIHHMQWRQLCIDLHEQIDLSPETRAKILELVGKEHPLQVPEC